MDTMLLAYLACTITTLIMITVSGVVNSIETAGELGTALHSVPSTSRTIRRFPEQGSKYFNILRTFKSVLMNESQTTLLVAGRDAVFQLNIDTFETTETNSSSSVLIFPTNPREYGQCYQFVLNKIECNNTMLFAVYYGRNIFACGTYSREGRCWLISPQTMRVLRNMPGEVKASKKNEFSPKKPDGKIVGLTAKNSVIFGAIQKDDSYTFRAILPNGQHIKIGSPKLEMSAPNFVTSFEASDGFIYFFFTENAYEVSERKMVYSRVGRICSFDRGSRYDFEFVTFSKSQIVCYKKGRASARFPDYYDHIQSATPIEVHDKNGSPEMFIYASFTTTIRSTGSSALCRYRLKDIQNLFQSGKYYVKKGKNGDVKYEPQDHPQPSLDASRMKCNSKFQSDGIKGTNVRWTSSNSLLYEDIEPYDKNTVATFRGERVTSLAVEDIHHEENKTDAGVLVIFAGTDSGKVCKVVMNGTNSGEPYLAEEIQATQKPGTISSLLLQKNYVIASGENIPLIRIDKERCESNYLMCSDCLKARDPYCAWSLSMKKCTRAANLKPSDRLQAVASGSDKKCPPVDVTISCSLVIVDNIPGSWTTIQCTGHGKIPPKVVAWKKDEARLDIDRSIYEIRTQNASSQLLILKGYTTKELGKYGCIVGLNSNKSECSVHIKGQKPQINCSANSSSANCTCHVSAHPLPSVRKVVNGNRTVRLDHHASPVSIRNGDILFAFNTFGDDAFACPLAMVSTTKLPPTTKAATTTVLTTTGTTTPPRLSTTQTTSTKSTTSNSTSRATTAAPTVIKSTRKTPGKGTDKPSTEPVTTSEATVRTQQTKIVRINSTKGSPPTPGSRVNCPNVQSDKWFIPFIICLVLLLIFVAGAAIIFWRYMLRRRDFDEEDEFDGKKGTLNISPSKPAKRNDISSKDVGSSGRKQVKKTNSKKPLLKREAKNGSSHSDSDNSGKTSKDTTPDDDRPNSYLMHVKT